MGRIPILGYKGPEIDALTKDTWPKQGVLLTDFDVGRVTSSGMSECKSRKVSVRLQCKWRHHRRKAKRWSTLARVPRKGFPGLWKGLVYLCIQVRLSFARRRRRGKTWDSENGRQVSRKAVQGLPRAEGETIPCGIDSQLGSPTTPNRRTI